MSVARLAGARLVPPLSILLAALVAGLLPVAVRADGGIHAATVQMEGAGERALQEAFGRALGVVLIKVTGRRDAAVDPALRQAMGSPAALVQQYRMLGGGQLSVQFDPLALRRRLDAVDEPVWGEPRPATLVWLVLDDGQGWRELLDVSGAAGLLQAETGAETVSPAADPRQALNEVAEQRGLTLLWPILDFQDLALVNATEVWSGVLDPLLLASQRYGAGAALVGRISLGDAVPTLSHWTLLVGEERLDWTGDLAEGVHGLADRLSARLATTRSGLQSMRLLVEGVDSLEAWGRLNAHLGSLDILESHAVERVSGSTLLLGLRVRGDAGRLAQTLALHRVLLPVLNGSGSPGRRMEADLVYRMGAAH